MSNASPNELAARLLEPHEIAFLDVREARQFASGHPNLARHAPLGSLELRVGRLVPRAATPVFMLDRDGAAGGPAHRAAQLLARLGYADVRIVEGGADAWAAAGLPLTQGYNTLVKAFADLARQRYRTPTIDVDALRKRSLEQLPTTFIDARPRNEYHALTIAGAHNIPGAELALRRFDRDKTGLLAINCFSRTRGIIGATTLRLLGLAEEVAFVDNGVMEWGLHGLPLEQNADSPLGLPELPEAELAAIAGQLIGRHALKTADAAALRSWLADGDRSLYAFDVRETAPDTAHSIVRKVAGGQLLMHYENHVATKGARIVLIDDAHRLRAAVTAFWLSQLNQAEVFILDAGAADFPAYEEREAIDEPPTGLSTQDLEGRLERFFIVDVGPSLDFEQGHLPGAHFLIPSYPDDLAKPLRQDKPILFTSPDGHAARLAGRDAARLEQGRGDVFWLKGGTENWKREGGKTETRYEARHLLSPFDDDWGSVMRVFGPQRDQAWQAYLDWESSFSADIGQDRTVRFQFFA
ncbi:rhodanese-like domain-containing protein [Herbaspirillum sp. WKF16]|uniref:rhodanese-like domain-containing protein n=1 Tax=Herbaspirillum sp. WKF16 TaxID=3028312 RepID=UPI0023A9C90C|nr:rhodanese-like domain-containing protein [Herbaspirillum sp. WKF16]WDZ94132.1 rhodanese-like domain-containing protein [Herbaspirillum sp. WKF16]